jgi:hypothetical protein
MPNNNNKCLELALQTACCHEDGELLQLLVDNGVDVNMKIAYGLYALDEVCFIISLDPLHIRLVCIRC